MSGPYRLSAGGAIDRGTPFSFRFDGKRYSGFAGDTLASALMANGVQLVGRSFKYHRPRGVSALGSAEPNALVTLRTGARAEPNLPATMVELFDGLEARSQNRFPSLRHDLLSVNQLAARFFVAGFYYKTFMWPASWWEPVYEKLIRRAAGLGAASGAPDPDAYEHTHAHCDVLVVGAGPAGLAAARAASEEGARVLLLDENAWTGGALAYERVHDPFVGEAEAALAAAPDCRVLTRTTAFGLYDHMTVCALERVSDHLAEPEQGAVRQRLWLIRPKEIVIAAGALERSLVFAGNDRPGVMHSTAARGHANRFAAAAGSKVAIVTTNDDGYRTALDLAARGVEIAVVADARREAGPLAAEAEAAGLPILPNMLPRKVDGGLGVRSLELQTHAGLAGPRIDCDAIAVAGGYSPVAHLASQNGTRPFWSDDLQAFVPPFDAEAPVQVAGAARGLYDTVDCIADGEAVGAEAAARALGRSLIAPRTQPFPKVVCQAPVFEAPPAGKAFVDLQNDVTAEDVRLADREGYSSVEHLKRYTTLGMATDQGKTSNVPGLAILAAAQGRPVADVGTTRFRPPYTPIAIGAFAGHERGRDYQPIRRTAFHRANEHAGAVFVEAGQWLRPRYYPEKGEDMLAAIKREAAAVRTSVGVCDVSTLGKIDIYGPDAGEFLNRLYINGWKSLAVGRARYGVMLREDGHIYDDGTTSRLAEDHYFMTVTTANAARVLAHMEMAAQVHFPDYDVRFCSATEQWAGLAIAGPNARKVLETLVSSDVSNEGLPYMGVLETEALGAPARLFRISFSGELAYEINVPWGYADALLDAVLEAGKAFDIVPYGTEALSVLRIEKGHIAGPEIDGRTTAADAGLGGMMSGAKDFFGKTLAGLPERADPDRPSLVGLKPVPGAGRLRGGAHLVARRETELEGTEGWVSSVADSPNVGSWIGLGFVKGGKARIGDRLIAAYPLKDEFVEVEICDPCFVDPEGERLRA